MSDDNTKLLAQAIARAVRTEQQMQGRLNKIIEAAKAAQVAGLPAPEMPKSPVISIAEAIVADINAVIESEKIAQLSDAERKIAASTKEIEAAQLIVTKYESLKEMSEPGRVGKLI